MLLTMSPALVTKEEKIFTSFSTQLALLEAFNMLGSWGSYSQLSEWRKLSTHWGLCYGHK